MCVLEALSVKVLYILCLYIYLFNSCSSLLSLRIILLVCRILSFQAPKQYNEHSGGNVVAGLFITKFIYCVV